MAGLSGWWPSNPFATKTVDRTSPAVLRSLEDLAEFNASRGHFEVVVDLEDKSQADWVPSWLAGERVLFVGVGTVDSVVSFEGLDERRLTVSPDGQSVTIRLPEPRLETPHRDLDKSYVYSRERGALNRVVGVFGDQTEDRPAYERAVAQMRSAAGQDGQIVALGKQNTTAMLRSLMRGLGFSSVDVVFEKA